MAEYHFSGTENKIFLADSDGISYQLLINNDATLQISGVGSGAPSDLNYLRSTGDTLTGNLIVSGASIVPFTSGNSSIGTTDFPFNLIYSNNIEFISGVGTLNTSNIALNTTNITFVSGTSDTNAVNIAANTSSINFVSGVTATNAANIATNITNITFVSGTTDTNTANITFLSGNYLNATGSFPDNTIPRADGGTRGMQQTSWVITDDNTLIAPALTNVVTIYTDATTNQLNLTAGNAVNDGARVQLHGSGHASLANQGKLMAGNTWPLQWSATELFTPELTQADDVDQVLGRSGTTNKLFWIARSTFTGGGGQINTASNLGGDEGWFFSKVGVDLQFRGITAGADIVLTSGATAVTVSAPQVATNTTNIAFVSGTTDTNATNIAANTANITFISGNYVSSASNLLEGEGVFKQKTGNDLEFKGITGVGTVGVTSDANSILISGNDTAGVLTFDVTQTAHGFSGLSAIFHDGQEFKPARAVDELTLGLWVVNDVADANNFSVTQAGKITSTAHGLTSGCYYFVDTAVSGALISVAPTGVGQFVNPLLFVEDENTVHVLPFRPNESVGNAVSEGKFVHATGDSMTGDLTMVNSDIVMNGGDVRPQTSGLGTFGTQSLPSSGVFTKSINLNSVDVTKSIQNGIPVGLINGGILTFSGLTGTLTAGFGYVMTANFPNHQLNEVNFTGQSFVLPSGQTNYISFDKNNTLHLDQTRPSFIARVLLGRATTASGGVGIFESIPNDMHHMASKLDRYSRDAFGPVYQDGSIVTSSGLCLNLSAGNYFLSENKFSPTGVSIFTFREHFQNSNGDFVRGAGITTTGVSNTQYDGGTGLVSLTSSNFAKHTLYLQGDNNGFQRQLFVFAQEEFVTLVEAQEADIPAPPSWFEESIVLIASMIVQEGSGNIVQVRDERPIIGFKASAGSAASTHGNLLGLGSDDHSQYLLTDGGRVVTGDLDMGGNNITNIGTASGTAFIGDVFEVNYVINGNGSVIESGSAGSLKIPYACAPISWEMINQESGTLSVDVRRFTGAGYSGPPLQPASIVGTEKPTIDGGDGGFRNTDADLTTWSGISANDWLDFHVDETPIGTTRATIGIKMRKLS